MPRRRDARLVFGGGSGRGRCARSVAHRVRSMEFLVGWSSGSVLAGGSGRSAVHRVLILALWEDRSAPHPAALATQPRNHAGTAERIRGADPNDPPRAPFPASSGLRGSLLRVIGSHAFRHSGSGSAHRLLRVIGSHGAPLASNRGSAGLLRVIGSRGAFESPGGAAPARPGAAPHRQFLERVAERGSCAPGGSADRSGGRGARRGRRPCGARGGAGCPNLPQRPGSRRSAGGDGLVKVADLG